jgi:hypothetical protein
MSQILPTNIIKEYGSTRAFKADKRRLLHAMRKLSNDFYSGSAYIPDEAKEPNRQLRESLKQLEEACSERRWGR